MNETNTYCPDSDRQCYRSVSYRLCKNLANGTVAVINSTLPCHELEAIYTQQDA